MPIMLLAAGPEVISTSFALLEAAAYLKAAGTILISVRAVSDIVQEIQKNLN